MRRSITLAAAAATILIGLGQATATTTTYTTVMYAGNSDSPDIDVSCKDFSVASTGVLSATCNYEASGSITTKSTTLDLDTVLGCDNNGNLTWQGTNFSDNSSNIGLELDSTGRDILVVATCDAGDPPEKDGKELDDGLNNKGGSLCDAGSADC